MHLWLEAIEEEYRESKLPPFIYRLDLVVLDEDVGGWTAAPVVMVKFNFYDGISDDYRYISWKLNVLFKRNGHWIVIRYNQWVIILFDLFAWEIFSWSLLIIILQFEWLVFNLFVHRSISRATFSHLKIKW